VIEVLGQYLDELVHLRARRGVLASPLPAAIKQIDEMGTCTVSTSRMTKVSPPGPHLRMLESVGSPSMLRDEGSQYSQEGI